MYYSKTEQCFKHGSETIENIELFWPKFRDALCRFLIESDVRIFKEIWYARDMVALSDESGDAEPRGDII